MSEKLVALFWVMGTMLFSLFLLYLVAKMVEKKETLKRNRAVAKLEAAMRSAMSQKLEDARNTLRGMSFDFWCKEMIKLPKYFWDCSDIELMAHTLRTCGNIIASPTIPNKEETLLNFSIWLGNLLLEKTRYTTDTAKAMAILASICRTDRKLAAKLMEFMAKSSTNLTPPVPSWQEG